MILPDLQAQSSYTRLSWGILLAAGVVLATRRVAPLQGIQRHASVSLAVLAIGLMWLPAAWSPAFWLAGGFQAPSLLTSVLASMFVLSKLVGTVDLRFRPQWPHSATISATGLALGLSTFGFTGTDLYALGMKPWLAAGLATGFVAIWWLAGTRSAAWSLAPGLAAIIYGMTRLPTGNAWDALIDPFLVAFSLVMLLLGAYRSLRKMP